MMNLTLILMSATMKFVDSVIILISTQELNVQVVSIPLDITYHDYHSCAQLIALTMTFDWWVELLTTREESKYVTIVVGWHFAAMGGLIKMLDRCVKSLDLLALVGS